VIVHEQESIPSTYNDPTQTILVTDAIKNAIGENNVELPKPVMAGEDFGLYGRTDDNLPITLFWLGGVNPETYNAAQQSGGQLPSLHSSKFAPDYNKAIPTGVKAMPHAALKLFN
ncbi:amidohydrolase, partial [Pseudoalteromonas sp. S407]